MAKQLWSADSAEPWIAVQQAADETWQQHASEKLQELNKWYAVELPQSISSRAPEPHITQPELVQLVDWKLSRGKWRPRLLDFAKAAQDKDVIAASKKAFSTLLGPQQQQQQQAPSPSAVSSALSALTVLKGVGPATASALLAAADGSGSTPFMSDEALEAAVGSRSYTAKEYLQLVSALRTKADWLNTLHTDGGWTAVKVEGCLFAAQLAAKTVKTTKQTAAAAKGKQQVAKQAAEASGKGGSKSSTAAAAAGAGDDDGDGKKRGRKVVGPAAAAAAAAAEDEAEKAGENAVVAARAMRSSKRSKGS